MLNERSKKNLIGVHPDLVRVIEKASERPPYDFTVTEGVRTVERQQELYAQGRTKQGSIVTNVDGVNKKSNHQPKADGYGYAVDLYPHSGVKGRLEVNDVPALTKVANHILAVAKSLGVNIEWGGNWRMRDYPHFELKP